MNSLRRLFSSVPGAVEIYRAGNRLKFYRGFGLFCFGHTVLWSCLTYYQGWYKNTEGETLQKNLIQLQSKLGELLRTELSTETTLDSNASSADSVPKKDSFFSSVIKKARKFSDETKEYDKALIPILTTAFGELGYF
ncbi:unnamed protein product [Echinostoma caproni]|uniref:Uncharacterized protein n=1 Tax=Echinostoma caproni TaxID=27848 RepID=A0A183BBG8_9TREM|nr:unnamed protein product [Echinostoma caproni]